MLSSKIFNDNFLLANFNMFSLSGTGVPKTLTDANCNQLVPFNIILTYLAGMLILFNS